MLNQQDSSSQNLLHFLGLLCGFRQGKATLYPRGYLLVHITRVTNLLNPKAITLHALVSMLVH